MGVCVCGRDENKKCVCVWGGGVKTRNCPQRLLNQSVSKLLAEAVGNVLAKNKTLEVFHLDVKIIECSPIVRGLLENKTLKEFGTSENTKKNIITCPEYVDVRQRIVFVKNLFLNVYEAKDSSSLVLIVVIKI